MSVEKKLVVHALICLVALLVAAVQSSVNGVYLLAIFAMVASFYFLVHNSSRVTQKERERRSP